MEATGSLTLNDYRPKVGWPKRCRWNFPGLNSLPAADVGKRHRNASRIEPEVCRVSQVCAGRFNEKPSPLVPRDPPKGRVNSKVSAIRLVPKRLSCGKTICFRFDRERMRFMNLKVRKLFQDLLLQQVFRLDFQVAVDQLCRQVFRENVDCQHALVPQVRNDLVTPVDNLGGNGG